MSTPRSVTSRQRRTRYAVLGMLGVQGPASGYDLRQRIDDSVGHFWQEGYGQLYPVLNQLAEEGLVERTGTESGAGEGRGRGRVEYRITPSGQAALAEWLRHPPVRHVERNELLLKVFFGDLGELDDCIRFVTESRQQAQAQLVALRAVEESLTELAELPGYPLWTLTLDYGLRAAQVHIAWCDHALEVLRAANP